MATHFANSAFSSVRASRGRSPGLSNDDNMQVIMELHNAGIVADIAGAFKAAPSDDAAFSEQETLATCTAIKLASALSFIPRHCGARLSHLDSLHKIGSRLMHFMAQNERQAKLTNNCSVKLVRSVVQ